MLTWWKQTLELGSLSLKRDSLGSFYGQGSSWPLPSPPGGTSGKQTFKASSSKEGNQPPPASPPPPFPSLPSPNLPPLSRLSGIGFLTPQSFVSLHLDVPKSHARQLRIASCDTLFAGATILLTSLWMALIRALPSRWSFWGMSQLQPGMSTSVFSCRRMMTNPTRSLRFLTLLECKRRSSSIQTKMGCSRRLKDAPIVSSK